MSIRFVFGKVFKVCGFDQPGSFFEEFKKKTEQFKLMNGMCY